MKPQKTILCLILLASLGTAIGFVYATPEQADKYPAPPTGTAPRTLEGQNNERVSVKDFGAKCDGVTDDTIALRKAIGYASENLPMTIYLPRGKCLYSGLGNLAYSGLSISGESHRESVLKFTGRGTAILIDAFASGSPGAPFVQAMNLSNLTVEGNGNTSAIISVRGLARSAWSNVFAREANAKSGIAFDFKGVMLSKFDNIGSSTNLDRMVNVPFEGLRLDVGSRAGVNIGNSSNNTFTNAYFEGLSIGVRLAAADQNTFVSGSSETNSGYDLLVASGSRYNTFIGMGFESPKATANVSDSGVYSKFVNCYANKKIILQGRGGEITGGYFQRIEVLPGAVKNQVRDVTLKHWESSFPGTGGYVNAGTATESKNLFDDKGGVYLSPLATRTKITVTDSPFVYTNSTGQRIRVILQTGAVTQIRTLHGTDSWLSPTAVPGSHVLEPSESIEVSYTSAPQMSYLTLN